MSYLFGFLLALSALAGGGALPGPACQRDAHQRFVLLLAASALGPCPTENGTGCELSQMRSQMTLHRKVFVTNYVSIKKQSIGQCAER